MKPSLQESAILRLIMFWFIFRDGNIPQSGKFSKIFCVVLFVNILLSSMARGQSGTQPQTDRNFAIPIVNMASENDGVSDGDDYPEDYRKIASCFHIIIQYIIL